jgi:ABC-type nickel/cobalt efflux system permease component RcnA
MDGTDQIVIGLTRWRRRSAALGAALLAVLALPALATAHPLGNFTINHYAGVRIEPDRILLDVVIDQAEIPAFQARLAFDTDGDGELSAAEVEAGRVAGCRKLASSLDLDVGGARQVLELTEAGLAFPPGVGGLSTMRQVCGFVATPTGAIAADTTVAFADRSFAERLGWREVVVQGSGVTLTAADGEIRSISVSDRLTHYPTTLLAQALADTAVSVMASPGGPMLAPFDIPDASALSRTTGVELAAGQVAGTEPAVAAQAGAVPGGVTSGELPSIFRTADLTPLILVLSVLTAAGLGAWHAVTPGHGKTLMAAYLVGTRGRPRHAVGLGLSVALSHTIGILTLAALIVGAQGVLPPEVVLRTTPVVAAISVVAIGGWMLLGEARRRLARRAKARTHELAHASGTTHEHATGHEHTTGHEHGHDHAHEHDHEQGPRGATTAGEHRHGGLRHSHLPGTGSTISWRSLFILGLAGGLIPSASALLILLGSVAAGRPAFGFVLVVAFGLGMALVMGGIGLALVVARGRLDRVEAASPVSRLGAHLPLLASVVVLGLGFYLTVQAVSGNTTF